MKVTVRLAAAVLLSFVALLLMSLAMTLPEQTQLSGWAILAALAALLPAGWLIIDEVVTRERRRTRDEIRDIARIIIAEQKSDLRSV
jgi:hypothetical protein